MAGLDQVLEDLNLVIDLTGVFLNGLDFIFWEG